MVNKSKRRGTDFESLVVSYLRQWFPKAERRALAGKNDLGDVINVPATIECKAARRFELSQWCDELRTEKSNANEQFGFVVIKRPNQNVRRAYVLLELEDAVELLLLADRGRQIDAERLTNGF